MAKTLDDLITEAKSKINEVDVNKAHELLSEGYTIVDVRESFEFDDEHVPDSIHIPRGVFESAVDLQNKQGNKALQEGRNDKWLILCRSGVRSAMVADVMQQMGFTDVMNITGGILAWTKAGLTVTSTNDT